ncbi:MAG: hypothetical protein LBR44_04000 [Clostridiales Family XIII bacterium]|jgi:hypothetical protein|nr:hypothetical protein [Clostridiales Family XIII bacterium]
MKKLIFSSRNNDTTTRKALRGDAYLRLFRGVAVERAWWESLWPSGRHLVRAAAFGGAQRNLVLTKLSAAAVLGAQIKDTPPEITCAPAPARGRSYFKLPGVRIGLLPRHSAVVRRDITLRADGTVAAASAAHATNADTGAEALPAVRVQCTSPACTMYDVAAAYPLAESLVVLNSLLAQASAAAAREAVLKKERAMLASLQTMTVVGKGVRRSTENLDYLTMTEAECDAEAARFARENGRALRAGGRPLSRKGIRRDDLTSETVAALLRAKSFPAFVAQVDSCRQHGLNTEAAAALLEECLALVWKNRGHRGVRHALLAFLLATDQCESVGESLSCARFFELGLSQPTLQVEFHAPGSDKPVYRVDGAWDLRKARRGKKPAPFPDKMPLGDPAPPASKQALLFEFDGRGKYADSGMLQGRDRSDVLAAQIKREADLREGGYEIVRATWEELQSQADLARKLSRFAIPALRKRRRRKPRPPSDAS